jgi:predicted MPP superfamily phosphohydrolase
MYGRSRTANREPGAHRGKRSTGLGGATARRGGRILLYRAAGSVLALLFVLVALGYKNAVATPIERSLHLNVEPGAADQRPVRLILLSDIHVHGPDMPPARLEKIVGQINAQQPDIIVVAGDFIGNNLVGANYSIDDSVAPLAYLRSRLGVYAVLGNNDHVLGPKIVTKALTRVHVRVLRNDAVQAGPIVLGGADYPTDNPTRKAVRAVHTTFDRMHAMQGLKVLASHSPDVLPQVPQFVSLVLAGHTHCGQIVPPLIGSILTASRYRLVCGIYRRGDTLLVVTAGIGTSHVPLRFGAPPDFWVIDVRGDEAMPLKTSAQSN